LGGAGEVEVDVAGVEDVFPFLEAFVYPAEGFFEVGMDSPEAVRFARLPGYGVLGEVAGFIDQGVGVD
jgi:hypothetical protein